jgi:hypothetical protein
MTGRRALIAVSLALALVTVARSGHELPVYPSYYPHEIELTSMAPDRAAELLLAGKIQAYVGDAPRFASAPPATIGSIESLGSFIVLRVNPDAPMAKDALVACAATESLAKDFIGRNRILVLHPYPVTPFHGDYLQHFDLAEAAKARVVRHADDASRAALQGVRVRAEGEFARSLVRTELQAQDSGWDIEIDEVAAVDLVAAASHFTNGWIGPAWLRAGWFHASLLLGDQVVDEQLRRRIKFSIDGLRSGAYGDAVDRINLERSLVSALTEGCTAFVAGYTVKREYFSTVFTAGIENISFDAFQGFNAPMFIRTVKLRDFPWNGWLSLGINAPTSAAWNPIAGFTDGFGRLMWAATSDTALIPSPYDAAWMFNRIVDVQSTAKK